MGAVACTIQQFRNRCLARTGALLCWFIVVFASVHVLLEHTSENRQLDADASIRSCHSLSLAVSSLCARGSQFVRIAFISIDNVSGTQSSC